MRRAGAVLAAGLSVAVLLAVVNGLPASDTAVLVALSFGAGALCYAVGAVAMTLTRRRIGIGAAATIVALIPVVSVAAGALAGAKGMFVSAHDLAALVVIVVGSCTAGILGALRLADDVAVARREAEAAAERERLLDQSRRELVAWVSHDLRTPLAGIRAMVEAIDDGLVDDVATVRRYHRQIGQDVETLAQLIDDLFELSRIEADSFELTLEPVAVGAVVSDAVAAVSSIARVKEITLSVSDPERPVVAASTRELTRVVHNLLDNAIKHTPPGGAVEIHVADAGTEAVITVRDQCGGIPEADLDRVFDVAYSGDRARTPGGGSGLGLAIARGFVEAQRGQIDVLNERAGCCFTIRIPVAR